MIIELPLRIVSVSNLREHWRTRAKRAKTHRTTAKMLTAQVKGEVTFPCVVTLLRIGPKKLDDDNLSNAFKNCRDGVADGLGIDDGDERVKWLYEQRRGKPREYTAYAKFDAA